MSTFDPTDQPLDAALADVTDELERIQPVGSDQSRAEQGYYEAELQNLRAALLGDDAHEADPPFDLP